MKEHNRTLLLPSALLAISITLAGFFISNTLYKSRVGFDTITVKGLAEKRVEADQANWRVSYGVAGRNKEEIPSLYKQAEANRDQILSALKQGGITEDEITVGVINYSVEEFRGEDKILVDEKHSLTGLIEVQTDRVSVIEPVRASINELLIKGVSLINHAPKYRFTGLNAIKPEMLKEATKNAQVAAKEFSTSSGSKVGRIRTAKQGGFTIVDVGENYGDTKRLKKDVRVVTTAEFYIE